jgi:serine/threonine protein kinase
MECTVKPLSNRTLARLGEMLATPDFSATRYRLEREIGRGGMGVVYLAEDTSLERRTAIKALPVELSTPAMAERLNREARVLARLDHPNIVPVYDAGALDDGRVYYAMKYVEGTRLDEYRDRAAALPDLLRLFEKLCEGVAFAHARGVVHRDLKPENVMVGSFGEVLLMDWGIAKVEGEAPEAPGTVAGTSAYMAPEQARGDPAGTGPPADVYALGGILRFLMARFPHPPRPLRAVWERAMAEDPSARYANANEVASEVARFLDGDRVEAYRESPPERVVRFVSRHRALVALVAVYVVVRFLLFFLARR